ncbi:MAG: type II CAAX endopeptidase family protein [Hyphomicrobiaceae bacterium]
MSEDRGWRPPADGGRTGGAGPGQPPSGMGAGPRQVAAALGVALAIVGVAIFLAGLVTALAADALGGLGGPRRTLAFLIVLQAAIAFLSVLAAGRFGPRDAVLSLAPVRGGSRAVLHVLVVMAVVLGLYTILTVQWFPELVERDLGQFRPVLASELALPAFVALAVGAPLSEELLFRGFLMGVLRRSWLGYSGAGLVATLGWTGLHWGYSAVGLIEVFIAGMIFSWALWRTGSIIAPIACHALYNATVLAVLWTFASAG